MSEAASVSYPLEPRQVDIDKLQAWLAASIVGQEQACAAVLNMAKRISAYEMRSCRSALLWHPLFFGPSRVGKMELARGISAHLYGPERLYVVNCAEFQERADTDQLNAALTGLCCSARPTGLEHFLMEKRVGVIVFDRFENAHWSLRELIMAMIEDVHFFCGHGRYRLDECILIVTTNVGADEVSILEQRNPNVDRRSVEDTYFRALPQLFGGPGLTGLFREYIVFNSIDRDAQMRTARL